jgi:hypothetical protein
LHRIVSKICLWCFIQRMMERLCNSTAVRSQNENNMISLRLKQTRVRPRRQKPQWFMCAVRSYLLGKLRY